MATTWGNTERSVFCKTSQEVGQFLADVVLRRCHLERQDSAGVELLRRLDEKLLGIKAVQLRGKGIWQVNDDDIELRVAGFEEQPPIHGVDAYAWVAPHASPSLRKVALCDTEYGRVQFDVLEALEAGVLEGLGDAAVDAAADEQQRPRRGVFEKREVYGLLCRRRVRHRQNPQPIFE